MKRRLVIIISLLYIALMVVCFFYLYSKGNTFRSLVAIGGIACAAIPLHMAFFNKWQFNMEIVLSYLVFLFASQFLGSILDWYSLGWWDTFMHFLSGGILAFVGLALYDRYIYRNEEKDIAPWFVFLFTLAIAVLGGVVWEIYEFNTDQIFGTALQGIGVTDTMTDLEGDTAGGLIAAVYSGLRTRARLKSAQKNR